MGPQDSGGRKGRGGNGPRLFQWVVVMVVTRVAKMLSRALTVLVVMVVATTGAASTALAQEDDPSVIGTGLGAAECVVGGVAPSAGDALEAFGAALDVDIPSCSETADTIADAPQTVAKEAASGAFEVAGLSFGDAGAALLKFALGWWISIPGQDEGVFTSTLAQVTQYTYWIQVAFLATSIMFLGIRLAMAYSGKMREVSTEGLQQLARATVLSGCIGILVVAGTRLSDGVSEWFINGTVGSDPEALVDAMIQISAYPIPGGTALLFVIGVIGGLGGIMMAFLLLMRMGLLVVVSAALPIAGAAGGTKIGSQAYEKMIAWTLAFLLFKPVGSFVIGIAAMLFMQSAPSRDSAGGAMTALVGAMLLGSAALVLPSLMRVIVPAVGAVGGGGSGVATTTAVASGAAQVGGLVASGGASAGAGAAAGGAGAAGASGSAPSGAQASAPSSFGTAGGESGGGSGGGGAAGGADGTPAGQGSSSTPSGGGAAGGADGTPVSQGTSTGASGADGGSRDDGGAGDSVTGAMPASNNGGFEG